MIQEIIRNDAMASRVRWCRYDHMYSRKVSIAGCCLSYAGHLYLKLSDQYSDWDFEEISVPTDLSHIWVSWSKGGETEVQLRVTRTKLGGYTIQIQHYWDNEVQHV